MTAVATDVTLEPTPIFDELTARFGAVLAAAGEDTTEITTPAEDT
jgi:hypothetical protein